MGRAATGLTCYFLFYTKSWVGLQPFTLEVKYRGGGGLNRLKEGRKDAHFQLFVKIETKV